ncbi:MAG: calcium-binding protein, partial [Cyanobacteria bacterium P01_F01_bin.116]
FYTLGGDKDYALITDLNVAEGDTIQLNDQFNYSLGAEPKGTTNAQGLFVDKNGNQELIAVIQMEGNPDLTDRAFVYV